MAPVLSRDPNILSSHWDAPIFLVEKLKTSGSLSFDKFYLYAHTISLSHKKSKGNNGARDELGFHQRGLSRKKCHVLYFYGVLQQAICNFCKFSWALLTDYYVNFYLYTILEFTERHPRNTFDLCWKHLCSLLETPLIFVGNTFDLSWKHLCPLLETPLMFV